jgi:hypothetical protein
MTEAGAISTPICMMTRKVDDDWNAGKEAVSGFVVCFFCRQNKRGQQLLAVLCKALFCCQLQS